MKISLHWLKDHIDIDIDPPKLGEILTAIGLEVEGIDEIETVSGGLRGLVVGQIMECGKHPNADRLSLTKVDIGDGTLKTIVCGAPNVAQGQKVIVATVGTILYPTKGEPFKIKKGKIRGEVSEGMICAEDEIGMGVEHDGIMVLPDHVPVGSLASKYFNVETDIVYDIGLTPNRSDATSHLGVAKDLAAYLKVNEGHNGDVKISKNDGLRSSKNAPFTVEILTTKGCPRFSGVTLSNIKIGASPEWMKRRLAAIGVKPINNIVDITNYVLHVYGQPLHAYDLKKIKGGKIIVQTLPKGSKFVTLDGIERKLRAEDVIICNGHGEGMCIGGVFGGADTGVTDATREIFLEAAHFNAQFIRKTSTKHNLRTDAAKVFEKGSDPNVTMVALQKAAYLMQEYAEAEVSSQYVDIYPNKIEKKQIVVRKERINTLIGNRLEATMIENIFEALHIDIISQDNTTYTVSIPTDKADVTREADIVEEILRIYGFNNVIVGNKLSTTIRTSNYPSRHSLRDRLAKFLIGKGLNEMMGMSLIQSVFYTDLGLVDEKAMVRIKNTSNIHLDIMRPEMILSGLESIRYNINRQQINLSLFEFGRSYQKTEDDYQESEHLVIYITGAEEAQSWHSSLQNSSFYTIKRIVHELFAKTGVAQYKSEKLTNNVYEYGMRYFLGDKTLAQFGLVSGAILDKMEIKNNVFVADINMDMFYKITRKQKISIQEINKFPSMRRDLSLIMDEDVAFEDIKKIILSTERKLIKEVSLFDIYKNEKQLGKGKKSYAISLVYEDKGRTLNDAQVDKSINNTISALSAQLKCEVR
ncbi:MAG: phenylalanine--tRNA ligase subunit beta [Saprospiraceae bacterium]